MNDLKAIKILLWLGMLFVGTFAWENMTTIASIFRLLILGYGLILLIVSVGEKDDSK
jgi:multisubunit Na+/H+ antiporter MnhC subunit